MIKIETESLNLDLEGGRGQIIKMFAWQQASKKIFVGKNKTTAAQLNIPTEQTDANVVIWLKFC